MNIYLVGFMGTGKTSVGKELAKKTKRHFVDLDELIEFKVKRSIADIFSKSGEPNFRKIESRALKQVSREKNFVVGCGGGIVLDKNNIKVMKKTGLVVCLKASPQIILKRVCGCSHRPLLNVADQKERIMHLLKLRSPYYALADKSVDTSKLTVKQVVSKITKLLITKS